nr:Chain A, SPIKE PROTEIN P1 [Corticovirus PM2]2VVE_B Chain B, SPIKE PROTEIN P1 [Corticovirus PM2]
SFQEQTTKSRDVNSFQIPLRDGVRELLPEDASRNRASIKSPVDIWIGGENMTALNGIVDGGRKFEAGQEFQINTFGSVNYWVSDEEIRVFKEYSARAKYAQNEGRTALEANNVPFFDIDVPPELDGVPFSLKARVRHKSKGVDGLGDYTSISVKPAFYITEGDETTDTLIKYTSYGSTGSHSGYDFDDNTLDVMVTLSAGVHRVFPVETELDYDAVQEVQHDWYDESFTTFIEVYSDDPLLTVKGYAQILMERT